MPMNIAILMFEINLLCSLYVWVDKEIEIVISKY